jgi:hypothetical protein
MLTKVLNQIPPVQDIGSVTTDGAFDMRKCREAIAARDAYTVIPPRKNAKPWKPTSDGAIAHNKVRSQPIEATHALKRSAGVSYPSVFRSRSLSCLAQHSVLPDYVPTNRCPLESTIAEGGWCFRLYRFATGCGVRTNRRRHPSPRLTSYALLFSTHSPKSGSDTVLWAVCITV